ncbi:unnamed protein product, partial [Amoebophrya sp. A25]
IGIIVASLVVAIGAGIRVSREAKKLKDQEGEAHGHEEAQEGVSRDNEVETTSTGQGHDKDKAEDYFLSGRDMPWYLVGASLFASNIGAEHFVGMAGIATHNGLAVALHEWLPIYLILLLAWFFFPIFQLSGTRRSISGTRSSTSSASPTSSSSIFCPISTTGEYLEGRFDGRLRRALAILSLITYIMTKSAVTLYAGALIFEVFFPIGAANSTTESHQNTTNANGGTASANSTTKDHDESKLNLNIFLYSS